MTRQHATPSTSARIVLVLLAFPGITLAVLLIVFWLQGLPGPHHHDYAAFASLHNIREGLRCYIDSHDYLPPASGIDPESGNFISWRIRVFESFVQNGHIAPPDGDENSSVQYDPHKAWNAPENLRLQDPGARLFQYSQLDAQHGASPYLTFCKAITGPGAAFAPDAQRIFHDLPGDLVLIVRVEHSSCHWMQPGDLTIEELAKQTEGERLLSGDNGYAVSFADGEIWLLSRTLPYSELSKFFTIEGAEQSDRNHILGPYRVEL